MLGRSPNCEAVLKQHGLEHCSMAVIGPDKMPDDSTWGVMITADPRPQHLDVMAAARLAADLRRVGELFLAERLLQAVELPRDRRD